MNKQNEDIIAQAKQLDQLPLDELTQSKLKAARLRALDTISNTTSSNHSASSTGKNKWMIPAIASSFIFIVAIGLLSQAPNQPPLHYNGAINTQESLSVEQSIELYENLEFYQWLATSNELS